MIIKLEDYRAYDAYNYSLLAGVDSDPSSLLIEEKDFSDAMKMGDVVDIFLTNPKHFEEKYVVADVEKPTASLLVLVEEAYKRDYKNEFEISALVDNLQLWSNIKNPDTLNKKWNIPLFWDYLDFLYRSDGKHILSIEENEKCLRSVDILKNDDFTRNLFNNDYEIKFQLPIVFEYEGRKYKVLLDMVHFDHKNKIIYPFDIKTFSDSQRSFPSKILYRRYDIQASLYSHALINEFIDYKIMDFKDIAYSFTSETALLYNMNCYLDASRDGFTASNGRYYKGWLELTDLVEWHREKELFKFPKEVYENNGEIMLEL